MSSYPTPIKDAREVGFLQALETAKDIELDMDIDTLFHTRRKIIRKRHFDENLDDTNVKHYLQKKYLESTILYLLLIKQFHHLQGGLNNIRASRKFLDSYLLQKHYNCWINIPISEF
jgi:hypothetical protein